jgi:hypothetical protein
VLLALDLALVRDPWAEIEALGSGPFPFGRHRSEAESVSLAIPTGQNQVKIPSREGINGSYPGYHPNRTRLPTQRPSCTQGQTRAHGGPLSEPGHGCWQSDDKYPWDQAEGSTLLALNSSSMEVRTFLHRAMNSTCFEDST